MSVSALQQYSGEQKQSHWDIIERYCSPGCGKLYYNKHAIAMIGLESHHVCGKTGKEREPSRVGNLSLVKLAGNYGNACQLVARVTKNHLALWLEHYVHKAIWQKGRLVVKQRKDAIIPLIYIQMCIVRNTTSFQTWGSWQRLRHPEFRFRTFSTPPMQAPPILVWRNEWCLFGEENRSEDTCLLE